MKIFIIIQRSENGIYTAAAICKQSVSTITISLKLEDFSVDGMTLSLSNSNIISRFNVTISSVAKNISDV